MADKMKKLDSRVVIGTRVMMNGKWYIVSKIKMGRFFVELVGMCGSFQSEHCQRFTNCDLGKNDPHAA